MAESSEMETTKPAPIEEELEKKLTITEGKGQESKDPATSKGGEEEGTKVKLITEDGVTFEVEPWMAKEMGTVQRFIDDGADAVVVPLPNVISDELARIVEYCEERRRVTGVWSEEMETTVRKFEERFMEPLSLYDLKELVMAANYLDTKALFECLTTEIANRIKNSSVEFVRDFFDITNDYTPEEEAEYRRSNAWAFQENKWTYKKADQNSEYKDVDMAFKNIDESTVSTENMQKA